MRETKTTIVGIKLLMIFGFVMIFPTLKANIADFDEVWQKRAIEAKKASLEAYQPHPEGLPIIYRAKKTLHICRNRPLNNTPT